MPRRVLVVCGMILGGCAGVLGIRDVPAPDTDGGAIEGGAQTVILPDGRVVVDTEDAGDAGEAGDGSCAYVSTKNLGVQCGTGRCPDILKECCAGQCMDSCPAGPDPIWDCESEGQCKGAQTTLAVDCCAALTLDPTKQCPRRVSTGTSATMCLKREVGMAQGAACAADANFKLRLCRLEDGDACPTGTTCLQVHVDAPARDFGACVPE